MKKYILKKFMAILMTLAMVIGLMPTMTLPASAAAGDTWTAQTSGVSANLKGVCYGGSTFVAVGASGTIITSSNGTSWTNRTTENIAVTGGADLNAVCYGNSMFMAVGAGGLVITSEDGASWTKKTGASINLVAVAYGNGAFVALGKRMYEEQTEAFPSGGYVFTSTNDGGSWNQTYYNATFLLSGICYNNTKFVVAGDTDWSTSKILLSADGSSWAESSAPDEQGLTSVCYGSGLYVACDIQSSVLTSSDGYSWTNLGWKDSGTHSFDAVCYGGTTFAAVGGSGILYISTNGTSWSAKTSGTSNNLRGICYGNGSFVAVGDSGAITASVGIVKPAITGISPAKGLPAGGTSVTIAGTNLGSATAVKFGDTAGTITANTATSITATSPSGSEGTVDITVTTASGTSDTTSADQFTYDGTAPTVTSVSSSSADGAYITGATVAISVTFSENVTVTGTPTLTLNSGGTASYGSGSGNSTLTFNYTVGSGQSSTDLDYSSTTALALNSGTIVDAAGNAATLTLPEPGAANSLGANKNIVIAVVPAVTTQAVTGISTTTATGNGNVTSLGVPNPTQYGVVWSTSANPTTSDFKTTEGARSATGVFTSSMTGLTPDTTYHVRAYATNSGGTVYGDDVSFKTDALALGVSSNTQNFVKTGASASISVTSNTTWTASSDQVWLTVSPNTATPGNATLTLTAAANGSVTDRTATVTISAAGVASQTITVTQSGKTPLIITNPTLTTSKEYDGTQSATVTIGVVSGVSAGDTGNVSVTATATYDTKDVGTGKTITVRYTLDGAAKDNYDAPVDYVVNTGEITKKSITVTVDASQTKVYGEADPTFTYSVSPALISGDTFSGALTRVAGTSVGKYAINQGTLANENYSISFVGADFSVVALAAPANLSATSGNESISLSWSAVTGATGYKIYKSISSSSFLSPAIATVTGTTYTVTGLTNGTKCYFVVKANNADGESADSSEVNSTPNAIVSGGSTTTTSTVVEVNGQKQDAGTSKTETVNGKFGGEMADVLITPAGLRGDELAAQLSLLTGGACVTAASELLDVDGGLAVRRSVYAGNLAADFSVQALPLAVSLLPGGEACNKSAAPPERVTFVTEMNLPVWLTDAEYRETERTCSLSDAKVVVAAGRGAGGAAGIEKLNKLAKSLGGILGGSRPVICEGKLPPDRQLGLSGSRAAPELCLVFGASGAAAFRAGIEGSRKIVAVNRDPQALIFEDCELGVVADCAEFSDALAACLERAKNTPSAGVDPEGAV